MSTKDVIKKSVLEGFSYADISTTKIMVTLLITFAIGVYIFLVYKLVTKSAFYFKNFNISMAVISVVTAGIILAMQSSIVISLGMVGALSIVRFRTAIKDPMDLLFLFWSIGTGIICGAGLYKIAIILAILVTIGILILDMIPLKTSAYLLIVNGDGGCGEGKISDIAAKYGKLRLRSKNVNKNGIDMIFEIRFKGNDNGIIEELMKVEGIQNVSLLVHDGEVKN